MAISKAVKKGHHRRPTANVGYSATNKSYTASLEWKEKTKPNVMDDASLAVSDLQFADATVGLSLHHLPVLLIVAVPLMIVLLSLGSIWLLAIPFISLQVVAIFLCVQEPQGASLMLHVMTLLAVALSLFLFGPILLLSWFHIFIYFLCIGSYVFINILIHLTLDSVVEDDKETAVTLEVALMKFFPVVGSLVVNWTFYSSIPVPVSHYLITFQQLLMLACFCYPHRSSFAGPMHRDSLLSYENSVILSLSEGIVGIMAVILTPFLCALLSVNEMSFDQNLFHLLSCEALIFILLSLSPCFEMFSFSDFNKKKFVLGSRYTGGVLCVVSLLYSYGTIGSTSPMLLSQLLVSIVGALTLSYFVFYQKNQKLTSLAVIFNTVVTCGQIFTTVINYDSPDLSPAQTLHQLFLALISLILCAAITSQSQYRSLISIPMLAFVGVWTKYVHFFILCGILTPLIAQFLTITMMLTINAVYRNQKDSVSEPVYVLLISWLTASSIYQTILNEHSMVSAYQIMFTLPSIIFFLTPLLVPQLFYEQMRHNARWRCSMLTILSLFIHSLGGGTTVSAAVYYLLTGYQPSQIANLGVFMVFMCIMLYQIWCDFADDENYLFIGSLLTMAGAGVLISVYEPQIISFRFSLSVGLLLYSVIWMLLVMNVPLVTRSDEMMILTAVMSGFCFGSIAAIILVPPSIKFVLMYILYVTVSISSSLVINTIWRFWIKQEQFSMANYAFNFILYGSIVELLVCLYSEYKMDVRLDDCYQPWISPSYPCSLVFLVCLSIDSLVIKSYQHKLANKYAHYKLPPIIQRTEKVFTCISLILALFAAPKSIVALWVPAAMVLLYRPEIKPWMSKQSTMYLSVAPMATVYTLIGAIFSIAESLLFVTNLHLSSWQLFCLTTEFFLIAVSFVCHSAVSTYLWKGYLSGNDCYFHILILTAPLGLLLSVVGSSFTSLLYGMSSTFLVLFVMWNDLPFSQ